MSRSPETFKGKRHDEDRNEEQALTTKEETPAKRQLDDLERHSTAHPSSTDNAMGLPAAPEVDQAPRAGSDGGDERETEPRSERQRRRDGNPSRYDREIEASGDAFRQHSIGYPLRAGVWAQPRWRADERETRRPGLVIARTRSSRRIPSGCGCPSARRQVSVCRRSSRHAARRRSAAVNVDAVHEYRR